MECQNYRKVTLVIKASIILLMFSCCKTKLKNGLIEECDTKGCSVGTYEDKKKEGTWKKYDDEDNLIQTLSYSAGKLNGASVSYYKNGLVSSMGSYINDIPHGSLTLYFENGQINVLDNYFYGKKEGFSYLYYKNGNIQSKWFYLSGKRDGEQYEFKENKDTLKIEYFKNGFLVSEKEF